MKKYKGKTHCTIKNKSGFTLIELMVALAIFGILVSFSVMGLLAWMKHAEFIKDEGYAKTTYMAAELSLSAKDAAGTLTSYLSKVKDQAETVDEKTGVSGYLGADAMERVYVLSAKKGDYELYCQDDSVLAAETKLLYDLITPYIYDTAVLDSAMVLEIDAESGTMYAAFVGTWADSFTYENIDCKEHGEISLTGGTSQISDANNAQISRELDYREEHVIGYYTVNGLGKVANLAAKKLRVTTNMLVNEEVLSLRFSSNSSIQSQDVDYTIDIFNAKEDTTPLFSIGMCLVELEINQSFESTSRGAYLPVTFYNSDGSIKRTEDYYFPLSFDGDSFQLTLDAMMSANALEVVRREIEGTDIGLNVSITRLLEEKDYSADIYARVKASPLDVGQVEIINQKEPANSIGWGKYWNDLQKLLNNNDYVSTAAKKSNTENALYGRYQEDTTTRNGETKTAYTVGIGYIRHLSNIRYYNNRTAPAGVDEIHTQFELATDLDWDNAVVYHINPGDGRILTQWSNPQFPALGTAAKTEETEVFDKTWTLEGNQKTIFNLVLGAESVVRYPDTNKDGLVSDAEKQQDSAKALGMILDNQGVIQNLEFSNCNVTVNASYNAARDTYTYDLDELESLHAAGLLCAVNNGTLTGITTDKSCVMAAAAAYDYGEQLSGGGTSSLTTGIGMLCGIQQSTGGTNEDLNTQVGAVYGCKLYGTVYGYIVQAQQPAQTYQADVLKDGDYIFAGIGGVAGFTQAPYPDENYQQISLGQRDLDTDWQKKLISFFGGSLDKSLVSCVNVSGNMFVGGITGNAYVDFEGDSSLRADSAKPQIINCENQGLILCSTKTDEETSPLSETTLDGRFIGGITGYSRNASITQCISTPGIIDGKSTAKITAYSAPGAHQLLVQDRNGYYVGGVVGCSNRGLLRECRTGEHGYVLGYNYVGGIAGYLTGDSADMQIAQATDEVVNASYIIGHSYVGGVVGQNNAGSTVLYCTNTGVVAGDGENIGGIAGANVGTDENNLAEIRLCTSYTYDYSGSIYTMVSQYWQMFGNNAGGIAGKNQYGTIVYDSSELADEWRAETAVSAVVVGNSNVGGVVGYNGQGADVVLDFKVIGGRVLGTGNCVGGYIGLNESELIFENAASEEGIQELNIQCYSITGKYMVGGIIGANLIDSVGQDIVFYGNTSNSYGVIAADGVSGGFIGYQAMGESLASGYDTLDYNTDTDTVEHIREHTGTQGAQRMFQIGRAAKDSANSMSIQADFYAGGVVGLNKETANLLITNVTNYGDMDVKNAGERHTVDVSAYSAELDVTYQDAACIGGIISRNTPNSRIYQCTNQGSIVADKVSGGIVGINCGSVEDCTQSTNFGTSDMSVLGGIVGINWGSSAVIENCRVAENVTISGGDYVGGIAAYNESKAQITDSVTNADIVAAGNNIGGIVGQNSGSLVVSSAIGMTENTEVSIEIQGNYNVGGLVGINSGSISMVTEGDQYATAPSVSINGTAYVGGLVGKSKNSFLGTTSVVSAANGRRLINGAAVVAREGYAGGIIGGAEEPTSIINAANYGKITANKGYAGGIISVNPQEGNLENCGDYADVTAFEGQAGGISAKNQGVIIGCEIQGITKETGRSTIEITITSNTTGSMGALCVENTGTIRNCLVGTEGESGKVNIRGKATVIGGLVGNNGNGNTQKTGMIDGCQVGNAVSLDMTTIQTASEPYHIGGITGNNRGTIKNSGVSMDYAGSQNATYQPVNNQGTGLGTAVTYQGFSNVQYLGGVAAINEEDAVIDSCTYNGSIKEASGQLGDAIGGIAAVNKGEVRGSNAALTTLYVAGAAAFSQADTPEDKLAKSVVVGGIVGQNAETGTIAHCLVSTPDSDTEAVCYIARGMLAGIAAYNAGVVTESGALADEGNWTSLKTQLKQGLTNGGAETPQQAREEALTEIQNYITNQTAAMSEMTFILNGQGYLGGMVGQNAISGKVSGCITGENWYLLHNSADPDSTCAGGISMNAGNQLITGLVNLADVRKMQRQNVAGIICRQENNTAASWVVEDCYNFGNITNNASDDDRCAGIISSIKFYGGTVRNCKNYGDISSRVRSSGIVATTYQMASDLRVIGCDNYGTIISTYTNGAAGIASYQQNNVGSHTNYFADCNNYGTIRVNSGVATGIYFNNAVSTTYFVRCANFGTLTSGNNSTRYAITNQNVNATYCRYCMNISESSTAFTGSLANDSTSLGTNYIIGEDSQLSSNFSSAGQSAPYNNYLCFDSRQTGGMYKIGARTRLMFWWQYTQIWEYSKRASELLANQQEAYTFYQAFRNEYILSGEGKLSDPEITSISSNSGTNCQVRWARAVSGAVGYELELYLFEGDTTQEALNKAQAAIAAGDWENREAAAETSTYNGSVTTLGISAADLSNKYAVVRMRALAGKTENNSNWVVSTPEQMQTGLPVPEIHMEQRYNGSGTAWYLILDNKEDYDSVPEDVQFSIRAGWNSANIEFFNQSNYQSGIVNCSSTISNNSSVMFLTQAVVTSAHDTYVNSSTVYHMSTKYDYDNINMGIQTLGDVVVSGTTDDGITLKTTVRASSTSDHVPIYRIEVVKVTDIPTGTLEEVVAYENAILTLQTATITFNNLPADLFDNGKDHVYIRAWLAESGKGPVRFYHEAEAGETPTTVYADLTTLGQEAGKSYVSTAMQVGNNQGSYSDSRSYYREKSISQQFQILTAPTLMSQGQVTGGVISSRLTPEFDGDNNMFYTFSWTDTNSNTAGASYEVTIKNGNTILYSNIVTGSSVTVGADSWNYDTVELSVTRIGTENSAGATTAIGRTGIATYGIYQRLERIGQPRVNLINQNDMLYNISWVAKDDATKVAGYRVYLKQGAAAPVLLNPTLCTNTYLNQVNLEPYSGESVSIYVVAEVSDAQGYDVSGLYARSQNGVMRTMTIPRRYVTPVLYKAGVEAAQVSENLVSETTFRNGMVLNADMEEASTLNGNYLLNGLIFQNLAEANSVLTGINSTPTELEKYQQIQSMLNAQNIIKLTPEDTPWAMALKQSAGGSWSADGHSGFTYLGIMSFDTIDSAGSYVIPLIRAYTQTDISSFWSWKDVLRLPMVQLDSPVTEQNVTRLTATEASYIPEAKIYRNAYEGENRDITITDVALQNLVWQQAEHADYYDLVLEPQEETEETAAIRLTTSLDAEQKTSTTKVYYGYPMVTSAPGAEPQEITYLYGQNRGEVLPDAPTELAEYTTYDLETTTNGEGGSVARTWYVDDNHYVCYEKEVVTPLMGAAITTWYTMAADDEILLTGTTPVANTGSVGLPEVTNVLRGSSNHSQYVNYQIQLQGVLQVAVTRDEADVITRVNYTVTLPQVNNSITYMVSGDTTQYNVTNRTKKYSGAALTAGVISSSTQYVTSQPGAVVTP